MLMHILVRLTLNMRLRLAFLVRELLSGLFQLYPVISVVY